VLKVRQKIVPSKENNSCLNKNWIKENNFWLDKNDPYLNRSWLDENNFMKVEAGLTKTIY